MQYARRKRPFSKKMHLKRHLSLFSPTFTARKEQFLFRHFPHGSTSSRNFSGRQQGVTQNSYVMPKVKTNSSAKKRFKVTGTGKITHQKAFRRHILTKKSTKRKRGMRMDGMVSDANMHFVKRLLGLK